MSKPLTSEGDVLCGHGGKAQPSAAKTTKLTVKGNGVLLKTDVMKASFDKGCNLSTPDDTTKDSSGSVVSKKCAAVVLVTKGEATLLTVGSVAVILDDTLAGSTDGMRSKTTPITELAGSANQKLLTAK